MVRFGHVALLAALGCSPVKDFSNVPDAPPDMEPAELASSAPEDGATKVSVLSPISLFFNESLDPASIDETTVKLSYYAYPVSAYPIGLWGESHGPGQAGAVYVKGTVSYDEAGHKVSFVPAAPLPYGTELTLSLEVKDLAGLATAASLKFTTFVNGNTKQFAFNGTTGAPSSWIGQPTDMNGRQTKYHRYLQPGADTIWFTQDDPRTDNFTFSYTPEGLLISEQLFNPGPDGQYDTPDDPAYSCIKRSYTAQKLTEMYFATNPGPDTTWCTDDDTPTYLITNTHADDKLTGSFWYNNPGTDMVWRTPDDRCVYFWKYSNDDNDNRVREVRIACNADGLPNTADDSYVEYYDHEYDADGNVTRTTWKTGQGPDGEWLNDDDSISEIHLYTRNADGQVTEQFISHSPGPDMTWGTVDDPTGMRIVYTYNAQKLVEDITNYHGYGPDKMWGTEDDVIGSYSKLTYDANGNRTRQKDYNAGPDGMWKNEDDRVIRDYVFDLDR